MNRKSFRTITLVVLTAILALGMVFGDSGKKPSDSANGKDTVYPAGKAVIYGYGQPQYLQQYFDAWLKRNNDIAPGVTIEIVQTEGAAASREKVTMTYLAGAYDDLPDALYIDPVNLMDLAKGNILKDETAFVTPLVDKMVGGATEDGKYNGKSYGLPESVRPQVLFYNKTVFDKYHVDPAMMTTMDGYIKAGQLLKKNSGGKVYLSYIDPGSKTWRYWGRRGLMPQANARIWDNNGNIVIGSDKGTALALGTLDTMNKEGLLLKSAIMEPALYDSMRNGEVATFYIGAFWDEFIRKNVSETSGQWRVMTAPTFASIGKAGAPVSNYFAIVNKPKGKYIGLMEKLWRDFQFDNVPRKEWVNKMVQQNAPYANPISLEMLKDSFWKEPAVFYGGQSFRQMEGQCLANNSVNLVVTPQDAEADKIISAEIEKYIAGDQTMPQAIANMDKNLKSKIGKAEIQK
jgi:ABC-type glycerol-3-phosphate transport system substrate-binding protein